jgi:predicted nucleotidyltransferase
MAVQKNGMEIAAIKRSIIPVLKKSGVKRAGIFGSYARGEQKKGSDLDLLVEISRNASLIDFVRLKLALEKAAGKKVDLVEYKAIKPAIKNGICREELRILDKEGFEK